MATVTADEKLERTLAENAELKRLYSGSEQARGVMSKELNAARKEVEKAAAAHAKVKALEEGASQDAARISALEATVRSLEGRIASADHILSSFKQVKAIFDGLK